jgi:actin-related protein
MSFFAINKDDVSSCVLDIGHSETRAGYSGEDQPRSVLPSVVGTYDK